MGKKYLYGASVQGIQSFIFRTSKLKEIVGASTLVEEITHAEETFPELNLKSGEKVMTAAGNIRYKLDEETCKKVVRLLPKLIANYAPGITISQAVVPLSGNEEKDRNELERRLRIQRNRPAMPVDIGFMGLERARRTAGVGVEYKEEVIDRATKNKTKKREEDTLQLFEKATGQKNVKAKNIPFELSSITGKSKDHSWLAIIHADGNSIGQRIRHIGQRMREFSEALETATKGAAKIAFEKIVPGLSEELKHYPIRPVILGGDDLTVIIRADLAFGYTVAYLQAFEKATKEHLGHFSSFQDGLTACAGIAYIRDTYPFHYGVRLAESLTQEAKKRSKSINPDSPPSSLSFYKVQSSFTDSLEEMKKRTHWAEASNMQLDYGPYLIEQKENQPHVGQLKAGLKVIQSFSSDKSSGLSKLRQWLSMLHQDKAKADFLLERMQQVNADFIGEFEKRVGKLIENQQKTIAFDLVQLASFATTKNKQ